MGGQSLTAASRPAHPRATRHGPIFPHRKSCLPGGYMAQLASSHGRRAQMRDDAMAKARRAAPGMERSGYARSAREWNRLALESIRLMRQQEHFETQYRVSAGRGTIE